MALRTLMSVQFPSAPQIAGASEQVEVAVLRYASSRRMRELPVCVRARGLKAVLRARWEDGDGGEPQDPSLPLLASDESLQRMGINVNLANDFEEEYEPVVHDKTSGFRPGLEVEGGYVGLFVRMLGLDNPAEDRERAVLALWRHSAAGAETVKEIVMFPGCLNLVVALLTSKREDTAEAAAALLRNISAIEDYRSQVAKAGALEEIAGLLTRHSISSEVRKQALCVLWNVSLNEEERKKVAGLELLPALLAIVDSEEEEEKDAAQMEAAGLRIRDSEEETAKEAAVGVLANLSYSPCNHLLLIQAGVIPILAKVLLEETSGSKVTRQEARTCLLNLAKQDPIQKSAIVEAGLVPVPLIGASAFRTFKPVMEDTFAIPEEDISFTPNPTLTTVFGADKLLRGLKIGNADDVDKTTVLLNEGKVRQQFLARIGVIEKKRVGEENNGEDKVILMPWWDGIARLVLILGLQNPSVAKKAAESLAEISITEDYRQAVHKAGAVPHLVKWLGSGDEAVTEAAALALDMLGKSQKVRRAIEAHGAVPALIEILRASGAPQSAKERVVSTLLRFSQEGEGNEEALTQEGAIPGLMDIVSSDGFSAEAKEEAEGILEELSSRRPDSRVKIIAAGGLSPLIEMLSTGSPLQAEKAASVLENLATEQRNAEAMVKAGVESALLSRLNITVQEEGDLPDMDTWTSTVAASKLLEALVKHKSALDTNKFAPLLLRILRNATTPAEVKNWVSPCLRRLQQQAVDRDSLPIGQEITVHDRIPRLVEQLGVSSQQEAAAMELQELVSQGVGAYPAAISSSGGIFPLVNLLENSTTPEASSAALAVLYNLGMDEENHVAMLAAGVAPPLQRWVKRGAPDWKLALYLLRTLPT